ncbi:acyl carrier protein [Teredinibacter sp. KSP-S5-2]|uniref:acyl carrier protein n=1 Tax=Teredinibacter sp. KSP-S5-2 TaxID=3034506 RepID=UPI0029346534|nr:acyl carrier protein [Teredinibacter sp. KSP-S5-2]WNO11550.1 acyl carrier protein [Teredinibacter sp. KSP-S5-2]
MTHEEIFNIIKGHTCEVLPDLVNHDFVHTDSLKSLGANSIDRSEILMMTLESLSVRVPMIEFAKAENMGDLARIFHEKL